jgi:hypothetical protein
MDHAPLLSKEFSDMASQLLAEYAPLPAAPA